VVCKIFAQPLQKNSKRTFCIEISFFLRQDMLSWDEKMAFKVNILAQAPPQRGSAPEGGSGFGLPLEGAALLKAV